MLVSFISCNALIILFACFGRTLLFEKSCNAFCSASISVSLSEEEPSSAKSISSFTTLGIDTIILLYYNIIKNY